MRPTHICRIFLPSQQNCANLFVFLQRQVQLCVQFGALLGQDLSLFPEQHWVSLHSLSWSSWFLSPMGSLSVSVWGAHLAEESQKSCVCGDDGADSCVGPIFDALGGWWEGKVTQNISPKAALTQRWHKVTQSNFVVSLVRSQLLLFLAPSTFCMSISAIFAASDGLGQIQNYIWILLYLIFFFKPL